LAIFTVKKLANFLHFITFVLKNLTQVSLPRFLDFWLSLGNENKYKGQRKKKMGRKVKWKEKKRDTGRKSGSKKQSPLN